MWAATSSYLHQKVSMVIRMKMMNNQACISRRILAKVLRGKTCSHYNFCFLSLILFVKLMRYVRKECLISLTDCVLYLLDLFILRLSELFSLLILQAERRRKLGLPPEDTSAVKSSAPVVEEKKVRYHTNKCSACWMTVT